MKTLKGIFITILALGMSTGVTGTVVADEQDLQYSSTLGISEEIERTRINKYCETGNLLRYKRSHPEISVDYKKYMNRLLLSSIPVAIGFAAGIKAGFRWTPFGRKALYGTLGTLIIPTYLTTKENNKDDILIEELDEICAEI